MIQMTLMRTMCIKLTFLQNNQLGHKAACRDRLLKGGLILPNGDINWNCPCLGGMASGPCGEQFKSAFSCFHYSQEEIKGSDCLDQFRAMQECMQKYPDIYPQEDDEDEAEKEKQNKEAEAFSTETSDTKEESSS
uniref:Mitochondrial intermembrane space import and assembly protein 40 n=1 Tax=Xenopus tropicalis TaxID=8364 RepID=A0A803JIA6_XENTR